uniref:Uncharacterized protein n=1 Tax=Parascaris equorum TaxID=6256 RepID=A0A914RPL7_PAREQ
MGGEDELSMVLGVSSNFLFAARICRFSACTRLNCIM